MTTWTDNRDAWVKSATPEHLNAVIAAVAANSHLDETGGDRLERAETLTWLATRGQHGTEWGKAGAAAEELGLWVEPEPVPLPGTPACAAYQAARRCGVTLSNAAAAAIALDVLSCSDEEHLVSAMVPETLWATDNVKAATRDRLARELATAVAARRMLPVTLPREVVDYKPDIGMVQVAFTVPVRNPPPSADAARTIAERWTNPDDYTPFYTRPVSFGPLRTPPTLEPSGDSEGEPPEPACQAG